MISSLLGWEEGKEYTKPEAPSPLTREPEPFAGCLSHLAKRMSQCTVERKNQICGLGGELPTDCNKGSLCTSSVCYHQIQRGMEGQLPCSSDQACQQGALY